MGVLTISSCSCLCSVELSFSCCRLYIWMISTTILSLSSSGPPPAATAPHAEELVSFASVTEDNGGRGGAAGLWGGMWVAFLQTGLLVSMETAWVWHSEAEAASAPWDLASSMRGGDA